MLFTPRQSSWRHVHSMYKGEWGESEPTPHQQHFPPSVQLLSKMNSQRVQAPTQRVRWCFAPLRLRKFMLSSSWKAISFAHACNFPRRVGYISAAYVIRWCLIRPVALHLDTWLHCARFTRIPKKINDVIRNKCVRWINHVGVEYSYIPIVCLNLRRLLVIHRYLFLLVVIGYVRLCHVSSDYK